jgi:ribose transport system substrate-binding protein
MTTNPIRLLGRGARAALVSGVLSAHVLPAVAAPARPALHVVMVPKVSHPWFEEVRQGALAAGRMITAETGRPVRVEVELPAEATIEQQQRVLRRAIASKPAGIFIDLLDSSRLTPLLREARAAGIQLVVFDSEAPAGLLITSVGNDYCKQAQIASERLVKLLGGRGEVAIMQGVPTAPNHAIRFRCHQEVFRRFPGIQVVATPSDQDSIATAEREALATMKAHPNLRGWVASDASGPIGIGRAIASLGAQGRVQAVGIDDLPELVGQIRSGVMNSSVATKPRAQGYWSILSLWQQTLAAPPIERIDTGITVVE